MLKSIQARKPISTTQLGVLAMTTDLEMALKHSDLLDRLVLDPKTAESLGRVGQLWLDPGAHEVLGFSCKSGVLGLGRHRYTWAQIESIGSEGIMVSVPVADEPRKPSTVEHVIEAEVWTDTGNKAGLLIDYRIHRATGAVVDYLFAADGWGGLTHGVYALPPSAIVSMTSKRVVAHAAAIQHADLYTAGITQKVAQAKDFVQDDYTRTKQDISGVVLGTQAIANQLKEKISGVAGQVQGNTQKLTEQAKVKLSDTASQVQQTTQQATGQAKEKLGQFQETSQRVTGQAKEKISDVADRVQQTTQQATGQAKEKFSQLQETTQKVTGQAKETFSNVANQVQETTEKLKKPAVKPEPSDEESI